NTLLPNTSSTVVPGYAALCLLGFLSAPQNPAARRGNAEQKGQGPLDGRSIALPRLETITEHSRHEVTGCVSSAGRKLQSDIKERAGVCAQKYYVVSCFRRPHKMKDCLSSRGLIWKRYFVLPDNYDRETRPTTMCFFPYCSRCRLQ
ncbi:uncharacterized protein PpBr36_06339, partial [Pyricularia pennisetigena]|uniref:uncharacterized protein n=1 Tax=Pyricularia pennisetigena TaxID=1578925 RepID=UPI00114E44D3